MDILKNLEELILLREWRQNKQTVGFVPTMGNLHQGHGALIKEARQWSHKVVVSVFVNPTQFNDPYDYTHYPRTQEQDIRLCKEWGVDALFMPQENVLYPSMKEERPWVLELPGLTDCLEGVYRAGHFSGVIRVILKLLHLIEPQYLFLGEKDYQQVCVIRRIVEDLFLPSVIKTVPTVRELSGLALSSRNSRLTDEGKIKASLLFKVLEAIKINIERGDKNIEEQCEQSILVLEKEGFKVDYLTVRSGKNLQFFAPDCKEGVILLAAYYNGVRLIDAVPCVRN